MLRKRARRRQLDPRGPRPLASQAAQRQARREYMGRHLKLVPVPQPPCVWKRARTLHQGRQLILGALQTARLRLQPRHWVSEERLRQAGVARSVLAPLPYNARMAMIRIPSRLYWQVRARTPAWDRRARERSRQRAIEKREARRELADLPALDFLFSLGISR